MHDFSFWARPWWVNLLLTVPFINLAVWRRRPLGLDRSRLLFSGAFAAAFGFVEASVVVYLRAALGLASGQDLQLRDIDKLAATMALAHDAASQSLMQVEIAREAATMVMLLSVGMLAARAVRDRWAAFLWMFAIWDVMYYVGLWATVRWPSSLLNVDVLFLIPEPWLAQVWFPVLISLLCMAAVMMGRKLPARTMRAVPDAVDAAQIGSRRAAAQR